MFIKTLPTFACYYIGLYKETYDSNQHIQSYPITDAIVDTLLEESPCYLDQNDFSADIT